MRRILDGYMQWAILMAISNLHMALLELLNYSLLTRMGKSPTKQAVRQGNLFPRVQMNWN